MVRKTQYRDYLSIGNNNLARHSFGLMRRLSHCNDIFQPSDHSRGVIPLGCNHGHHCHRSVILITLLAWRPAAVLPLFVLLPQCRSAISLSATSSDLSVSAADAIPLYCNLCHYYRLIFQLRCLLNGRRHLHPLSFCSPWFDFPVLHCDRHRTSWLWWGPMPLGCHHYLHHCRL